MESENESPLSNCTSAGVHNGIVDDDVQMCFEVKCSEFAFSFPPNLEKSMENCLEYDEDGDIVVQRKACKMPRVAIEHYTETYLSTVGLQIWGGCLLLTDYILSISPSLQGQYVLELGAGTGLSSIVASVFAEHVFATDGNLEVLDNCQRNVVDHEHELMRQELCTGKVTVKLMEWEHHGHCVNITESSYGWTDEQKELLTKVSLYLASDVIYDDDTTDNFFATVINLMEGSAPSTLYLSLEKRVNFVLETLSVGSPAYDHFRQHCNAISQKAGEITWNVQQIEVDFPQHFPYERNAQMELWKFQCQPKVLIF